MTKRQSYDSCYGCVYAPRICEFYFNENVQRCQLKSFRCHNFSRQISLKMRVHKYERCWSLLVSIYVFQGMVMTNSLGCSEYSYGFTLIIPVLLGLCLASVDRKKDCLFPSAKKVSYEQKTTCNSF